MTCHVGQNIVVCDGQSGGWRVGYLVCPWCCIESTTRCLYVWIFGGYGGLDAICGKCGQKWSSEATLRNLNNEEREKNIARVGSVADPKCWECHDTGSLYPLAGPDTRCEACDAAVVHGGSDAKG